MGLGQSSDYISEGEISDDDLDDRYFASNRNPPNRNIPDQIEARPNLGTMNEASNSIDAVRRSTSTHHQNNQISLADLTFVEKQLDEYELVSLLYLLYDNNESALQAIEEMLSPRQIGFNSLAKWVEREGIKDQKWPKKLEEALCIIQNYQVLKNFGHNKNDLQCTYLPSQIETSYLVNKLRKTLYLTAEKLTSTQTAKFINGMKTESNFVPNYNENYLELYFLYWEKENVNFKNIKSVFKTMDLELISEQLSAVLPEEPPNIDFADQLENIDLKPSDDRKGTRKDNTVFPTGSFEGDSLHAVTQNSNEKLLQADRYFIDSKNPGIVLIINQEYFYTEPLKEFEHLLHESKDSNKLPNRTGSTMDKNELEKVFSAMNFKVIVEDNLTHKLMLDCIEKYTNLASKTSSLIICILSHGANGVVFAANSCKVEVSEIQKIMRHKNLIGKPKVLILQSCQGDECQKIEEDDNTTDGATRVPGTADSLCFWATIPGFAAIRNMKQGSWFIQALCEEIKRSQYGSSRCHFSDICTKVMNQVTQKKWKSNVMTPMLVSTLTKAFYLPLPTK
ncbi:unnamed protein product [Ceutorhynchus assimilis]|uniref:Caspase-8 n=1 Tax=Ceutorhynchus assimilis TaxID=467358 RepID=A0A9N9QQS8_9CUCU|nr:unnamed protein product [Ceutorhynchus assimilis]